MNYELRVLRNILAAILVSVVSAFGGGLDDLAECHVRGGLPHFFAKINSGKPVSVAYIGGSITDQNGWRVGTFKYLVDTYPEVEFKQVHAAIPGTDSALGVSRIERDVLSHNPDLVFVEFAVNDGNGDNSQKTFEGMVRKIWAANINTDICFVYTIWNGQIEQYLFNGVYQPSARQMEVIADHYDIPSIHMAVSVAKLLRDDKLVFKAPLTTKGKIAFSPDGVHPYPETGHKLYTDAVVRSLKIIETCKTQARHLPKSLHDDNWQNAKLVGLDDVNKSGDWKTLTDSYGKPAGLFDKFMPRVWVAEKAGSSLSFAFKGRSAGIYGIKGPDVGMLKIEIDEQPAKMITFFDSYCTTGRYKLKSVLIADGLSDDIHRVKITLDEARVEKAAILAKSGNDYQESEEFNSHKAYIGDLIINGKLVELK